MMKILFICLGNICRSPLAEELFRYHIVRLGLEESFTIDSCGTGAWHAGELPDIRMRETALKNGIELTHKARQICVEDFENFDYLLVMDHNNYKDVVGINKTHQKKVHLISQFSSSHIGDIIPDPYFGDINGFDHVFNLLNTITSEIAQHFHHQYR